jgi:acetate kinase
MDQDGILGKEFIGHKSETPDVTTFPKLYTAEEIVIILPSGLRHLTDLRVKLDDHTLAMMFNCAIEMPEYNQTVYDIARQVRQAFPAISASIVVGSAFYKNMPLVEHRYALPGKYIEQFARYGSDGLCHFGAARSIQADDPVSRKVVSIHLCDQPSITGWKNGDVKYSSAGYSPLEGLISANGCGSIDPSIPLMLAEEGFDPDEIANLLVRSSGWNAVVGRPLSIQQLIEDNNDSATVAREILLDQITAQIGAATASLAGLDAMVFVVNNIIDAHALIQLITPRFSWVGYHPRSKPLKAGGCLIISDESSSFKVYVINYDPISIINTWIPAIPVSYSDSK